MATIDINLDDTPESLPPVEPGVRILTIKDIKEEESKQGDMQQVVELEVNQPDAPDHERKMWDRFNFKYPIARTKFKQLVLAAGHEGTGMGVEPAELIGTDVKAVVKPRVYKDPTTEEMVETTQVQKYLFGPDAADA
jgi:hypothetical protein